jgi:hypothetical protein
MPFSETSLVRRSQPPWTSARTVVCAAAGLAVMPMLAAEASRAAAAIRSLWAVIFSFPFKSVVPFRVGPAF